MSSESNQQQTGTPIDDDATVVSEATAASPESQHQQF
jgi:hypothetical protein